MTSMFVEYFFISDQLKHLQSLINIADNKGRILLTLHSIFFGVLTYSFSLINLSNFGTFDIINLVIIFLFFVLSFFTASIFVIFPRYANEKGNFIEPLNYFNNNIDFVKTGELINSEESLRSDMVTTADNSKDNMMYYISKQIIKLDDIVSTKFFFIQISIYSLLISFISYFGLLGQIVDFELLIIYSMLFSMPLLLLIIGKIVKRYVKIH